jgi:hypothetical protein
MRSIFTIAESSARRGAIAPLLGATRLRRKKKSEKKGRKTESKGENLDLDAKLISREH